MAAQYDLKKSVRPKGEEDETVLYPKVVPYGTKTLKNIMKDNPFDPIWNAYFEGRRQKCNRQRA